MSALKKIFSQSLELYKQAPEISSLFVLDLANKEIEHKIFDNKTERKKRVFSLLKKIIPLLDDDKFELLTLEMEERITAYHISNRVIIIITSNKIAPLGKILTLLKSTKFKE